MKQAGVKSPSVARLGPWRISWVSEALSWSPKKGMKAFSVALRKVEPHCGHCAWHGGERKLTQHLLEREKENGDWSVILAIRTWCSTWYLSLADSVTKRGVLMYLTHKEECLDLSEILAFLTGRPRQIHITRSEFGCVHGVDFLRRHP